MRDVVLGPTFHAPLPATADEAEKTLAAWIRSGDCPYDAARAGAHFTFSMPRHARPAAPDAEPVGDRHFWSPVLTMEVREENGEALVAGRFNPGNGIWAGYMLTYLALASIILGASMWGLAQLILGRTPWALAFIPACVVIGVVMFWASAVGQRIAGPQMEGMRAAVCNVLGATTAE